MKKHVPFYAALVATMLPALVPAQLCTPAQQITCSTTFANSTIIVNEFYRRNDGQTSLEAGAIVELLFIQAITPATLNEFVFGDSDDTRTTKNAMIRFRNTAGLLPNNITYFPPGTRIVIVGTDRIGDADFPNLNADFTAGTNLSFNPLGGDFVIRMRSDNTTYLNKLHLPANAGQIAQTDVIWIDRITNVGYSNTSVSSQGFGIAYGGGSSPCPASALQCSAVVVGVGTPGNKKCVALEDALSCACIGASWDNQNQAECAEGSCNANQGAYCSQLQDDPLLAVYQSYGAVAEEKGLPVVLTWTTSLESNNVGFHVYRALNSYEKALNDGNDLGERLTATLIPAQGSELEGATYHFATDDHLSQEGDFSYYIEDIDYYGKRTLTGPIPATFSPKEVANTQVGDWLDY